MPVRKGESPGDNGHLAVLKPTERSHMEYRFGECTVSATRREVVLRGQLQVLEPRPFDLLCYLIEHRERVVPKDELLQQLWPHEFVSDSVITRAVMKARQAIGDRGKEPELIRTVHRMGYRFVGAIEQTPPPDAETPAASSLNRPSLPHAAAGLPVALLPFDNRTGQPELDWIELGLMSLSAKALGADTRLVVASTPSVLAALGGLSSQVPLAERVAAVQRLLGVRYVVHATIGREGDQFRMDWGLDRPSHAGGHWTLRSAEVTQLGRQLAQELESVLFPEQAPAAIRFDASDALATQALARAMQAVAEQKWKVALNLLQVVLDIEPANVNVQLERARALAQLGDGEALRAARRLLDRATANNDPLLAAMAHEVACRVHHSRRMLVPAEHHAHEALRLAGDRAPLDWLQWMLTLLSSIALLRRDFAQAEEILERAQREGEHAGTHLQQTFLLNNRAVTALKTGDPVSAWQLAHEAVAAARRQPPGASLLVASDTLCLVDLALGLPLAAVQHGEEALALARAVGQPERAALAAMTLCCVYRELRQGRPLAALVAELKQWGAGPDATPGVADAHAMVAQAHGAALAGDPGEAARLLQAAVEIYSSREAWLHAHDALPWLYEALALSGQAPALSALHEELQTLSSLRGDADLAAAFLRAQALLDHARGDTEAALGKLCEAMEVAPAGLRRAHAGLDAAWLQLEAGDLAAAQRLVRDLGPWLREHPAGQLVHARLCFAGGRPAMAHEIHQRHAAAVGSQAGHLRELGLAYAAAAQEASAAPVPLPRAPVLPTVTF